jgi:hypothetical protein
MTSFQQEQTPPIAVVTGASRGLGRALATALATRGWQLVIDARDPADLAATVEALSATTRVTGLPGDVTDPAHRQALAAAVGAHGDRLDLLVNNAGVLGPSPLVPLAEHPAGRTRARLRRQHLRAPGAGPAAAPRTRPGRRPGRQPDVGRGGGGVSRLGWLRLGQGGSRPDERRARRRAAGDPGARLRPGRHGHGHAAAGLPGRGHQRPGAARRRRAGAAAADRRGRRERAAPSRGAAARRVPG